MNVGKLPVDGGGESEEIPMWIVSQIGAREHYAIPRALARVGALGLLCTDAWVRPGSPWGKCPGTRRLRDRYHGDLAGAPVFAPTARMLAFEVGQRLRRSRGWDVIIARNTLYQKCLVAHFATVAESLEGGEPPTLFSYSCAALELFRFAKARGWSTVLGQIDPGPEEERLVAAETRRYPDLATSWNPPPPRYWEQWREEVALADRILVNSEWSRQCLVKEGVASTKLEVVPLVYEGRGDRGARPAGRGARPAAAMEVLFLGQILLRKGMGRLLEAMRLLKDEPISLTLAGPSEIDPSAWSDLPRVKWVGVIPRSEVGRFYQAADLFILPTLSDGYALTQLEALANGLPVLASRHCGEAVTHGSNGWILADLEPATIAEALRTARETLPLPKVEMPAFGMDELADRLVGSAGGAVKSER
jgi:glycosyltransferase involved in cell wall biosynthesis